MFWTQFIFPFYAKKYDLIVNLTQFEASVFNLEKQVVVVHDLIPYIFKDQKHKHKFFVYKILPYILRKVKNICAVSVNTRSDLVKILGVKENKIVVIYESVDKNIEIYSEQNFELEKNLLLSGINIGRYILFVGSCDKRKNLENVIKAFDIVCEREKNLYLVVVGFMNENNKRYYKKIIKNFNKIKILGHISIKELVILYKNAELFLFPTLYEGFGLPPLEAMACGCPVVVSDKGSLPEVCGDAAVYVNPYDPQSIAEGILKVLTDENLRQNLIQKGYQQVRKFSWEQSVKKFLEVLNYK
jgi:glycosyltransferase involved in cell wall biosynthesis